MGRGIEKCSLCLVHSSRALGAEFFLIEEFVTFPPRRSPDFKAHPDSEESLSPEERHGHPAQPEPALDPDRGCGRRTEPACPWPGASSAWWPSWTGTAGTWCPGGCPTRWRPASAPRRWRRPWERGPARGVQHRSGEPVHQPGVHPGPSGAWVEDQHGREGAVLRQHLRGAVVARLWRTVKYGEVYLKAFVNVAEARKELGAYFRFYNNLRSHQAWATGRRPRCSTWPLTMWRRGTLWSECVRQTRREHHWQE